MPGEIKLKPMIIFKSLKNVLKVDSLKDVVTRSMKGSMNSDLTNTYEQKI